MEQTARGTEFAPGRQLQTGGGTQHGSGEPVGGSTRRECWRDAGGERQTVQMQAEQSHCPRGPGLQAGLGSHVALAAKRAFTPTSAMGTGTGAGAVRLVRVSICLGAVPIPGSRRIVAQSQRTSCFGFRTVTGMPSVKNHHGVSKTRRRPRCIMPSLPSRPFMRRAPH